MAELLEIQTLPRAVNELLILAAIRAGPMHGYQIALEIEERSGGYFTFKHGTLYPILHRLEKEGYIDGTWGGGRVPRRRKVYRLTAEGERYFGGLAGGWAELDRRLSDLVAGSGEVRPRAASGER